MPIVPSKLLGGHRTLNQHRRMSESDPQRHRANFCCDAQCGTRPANLTTGISQGVCSRSSAKVMVSGRPARVFPSASVNGKEAHRLSVCATAMRYDAVCNDVEHYAAKIAAKSCMRGLRVALEQSEKDGVAIGHFNVADWVLLKAVLASGQELKVPVVVGASEGEREFFGVRQIAALVRSLREECDCPIFLNADHTHSLAKAVEAARAGSLPCPCSPGAAGLCSALQAWPSWCSAVSRF